MSVLVANGPWSKCFLINVFIVARILQLNILIMTIRKFRTLFETLFWNWNQEHKVVFWFLCFILFIYFFNNIFVFILHQSEKKKRFKSIACHYCRTKFEGKLFGYSKSIVGKKKITQKIKYKLFNKKKCIINIVMVAFFLA